METFKSLYDDKGKLIKDELAAGVTTSANVTYFKEKFKQKHLVNQLDGSFVMLNRLQNARKQTKGKKIQDLITAEFDQEFMEDLAKNKGLIPVDTKFLVSMALTNIKSWSEIWREVKTIDCDRNGLISLIEIETLFRDYFPDLLEGKSLTYYFRQSVVPYDKNIVNYKPIKEQLNQEVSQKMKEMRENNSSLPRSDQGDLFESQSRNAILNQ